MINLKTFFWLLIIVLLAAVLRFYKLGQVPAGFFSDEAAVGYNAYSLTKTGKDEFGQSWPLIFKSFGEGKLPLYVYQVLPSVAFFGLTEFASRFPGAFFGTLSVLMTYFLVLEIYLAGKKNSKKKKLGRQIALLSSLFLAIMPWHIHFSRGVFGQESLFWVVLGCWLSQKALRQKKDKYYFLASLAFSASLLTYHAPRIFVPLWIMYILLKKFFSFGFNISWLKTGLLLGIFPGFIWLWLAFSPLGMTRASSLSVFSQYGGVSAQLSTTLAEERSKPVFLVRLLHNKAESYAKDIAKRYLSHFDSGFLFFSGDQLRPRYRVPNVGQLLLATLPFYFFGLFLLFKKRLWPMVVFFILSPLPAVFTFETPSSVRAIFMVVPLAVSTSLGLVEFIHWFKNKLKLQIALKLLIAAVLFYNLLYYLDAYYVHASLRQPYYWQYGYKELVAKVNSLAPEYKKVLITDRRGTPYIFFLFFSKYNPKKWQTQVNQAIEPAKAFNFLAIRKMDNLRFVPENCPAKNNLEKDVLYVCTQEDNPQKQIDNGKVRIIDTIEYQDNQPAFILMEKARNEI